MVFRSPKGLCVLQFTRPTFRNSLRPSTMQGTKFAVPRSVELKLHQPKLLLGHAVRVPRTTRIRPYRRFVSEFRLLAASLSLAMAQCFDLPPASNEDASLTAHALGPRGSGFANTPRGIVRSPSPCHRPLTPFVTRPDCWSWFFPFPDLASLPRPSLTGSTHRSEPFPSNPIPFAGLTCLSNPFDSAGFPQPRLPS